jgi:hypothetical protein
MFASGPIHSGPQPVITPAEWRCDPILARIYEYWQSKRKGRPMPSRRDIDPAEIGPPALQHVVLTEPVTIDGIVRFRLRLSGTAVNDAAGREMTGQFVHIVNPDERYAAYLAGLYQQVMETGRPILSSSVALGARTSPVCSTIRLMHPLSDDARTVNMILSAQVFRKLGPERLAFITGATQYTPGETKVIEPEEGR